MRSEDLGGLIIIVLAMVLVIYPAMGFLFLALWNEAIVPILGLQVINIWQSLGILLVLCIIGSFFKK